LFGVLYIAPCAWVLRSWAHGVYVLLGTLALLYIVQGAGS
jgi:hypothetical protein